MIETFYELLNGKKDKTAIFYKDEKISYKQLKEKIDKRCNELKKFVGIVKFSAVMEVFE